MPELQTPNLITPYQGLTFLAGLAAERNRMEESKNRNVIALQRMQQQMELQGEKTQSQLEIADMRHQVDMERAGTAQQRADDMLKLGSWANDIKDQRTQLEADRLRAKLDDQAENLKRQRVNLFKGEQQRYGLPTDAFENEEIKGTDVTPKDQGWYKDSKKPGQRFYNAPLYDANGQPTGKFSPITISDNTFKWLKGTYSDMKSDPPTRKFTDPDDTVEQIVPFPADKSQAVAGQKYSTPKGDLIWTGTGFKTP